MAIDNSKSVNDTRPPARPARLVAFMQYLPQVSSDAWGVDDIVKRQMRDKLGLLQKQRERLADTTSSTAHTDFDHGFNNNIVSSSRTKEKRKSKGISALSKAITKKSTPLAQVGTWRRPRHVNEWTNGLCLLNLSIATDTEDYFPDLAGPQFNVF